MPGVPAQIAVALSPQINVFVRTVGRSWKPHHQASMEGKNRVIRRDNNYLHTRSHSSKYPHMRSHSSTYLRMHNSHSNNKALSRRGLLRWVDYTSRVGMKASIEGTYH